MNEVRPSHVFILGSERSGSTWLANVLDAHPDVEFFMEPFADYANLFPGIPTRNFEENGNDQTITTIISDGYARLDRIKYPLTYKRAKSLFWKRADDLITRVLCRLSSNEVALWVKQYQLLSLNLKNVPVERQTKKNDVRPLIITKDLRLNFKVGQLNRTFPRAKYIVVVRHPGAQVASIMKLFERGNLGEFKSSLLTLYDDLKRSEYKTKYLGYFKTLDIERDLREILLLWWLINYQTLIEDCRKYNVDYRVVFNEDLSKSPINEFQQLFFFLGLDLGPEVEAYLAYSTMGSIEKSNNATFSALDTVRDSSRHSNDAISNIDNDMKLAISDLYSRFDVIGELNRYCDGN